MGCDVMLLISFTSRETLSNPNDGVVRAGQGGRGRVEAESGICCQRKGLQYHDGAGCMAVQGCGYAGASAFILAAPGVGAAAALTCWTLSLRASNMGLAMQTDGCMHMALLSLFFLEV